MGQPQSSGCVVLGRHRHDTQVEAVVLEHLVEVGVDAEAGRRCGSEPVAVPVGHRDEVDAVEPGQHPDVVPAHHA